MLALRPGQATLQASRHHWHGQGHLRDLVLPSYLGYFQVWLAVYDCKGQQARCMWPIAMRTLAEVKIGCSCCAPASVARLACAYSVYKRAYPHAGVAH